MSPGERAYVDRRNLILASLRVAQEISRLQAAMDVRAGLPSAIEQGVPAEEVIQRLVAVNDAGREEVEAYNSLVAAMKAYFDAGHVASRSAWDALRKEPK